MNRDTEVYGFRVTSWDLHVCDLMSLVACALLCSGKIADLLPRSTQSMEEDRHGKNGVDGGHETTSKEVTEENIEGAAIGVAPSTGNIHEKLERLQAILSEHRRAEGGDTELYVTCRVREIFVSSRRHRGAFTCCCLVCCY